MDPHRSASLADPLKADAKETKTKKTKKEEEEEKKNPLTVTHIHTHTHTHTHTHAHTHKCGCVHATGGRPDQLNGQTGRLTALGTRVVGGRSLERRNADGPGVQRHRHTLRLRWDET